LKIFSSFLVVLTAVLLFFLPFSEAVYDFRTDVKTDSLYSATDPGEATDNLTLTHEIYDDDSSTLSLLSSNSADIPVLSAYSPDSHSILVSGLSENSTRTLAVSYDIYALTGWSGIDTFVSRLGLFWILIIFSFVVCGFVVLFRGRA